MDGGGVVGSGFETWRMVSDTVAEYSHTLTPYLTRRITAPRTDVDRALDRLPKQVLEEQLAEFGEAIFDSGATLGVE